MAAALAAKTGLDAMLGSVDDLLAYTGRRLRNRIAGLADGAYTCTSYLDDDGQGGDPVAITATARISGDQLTLDFDGTAPQARGAMNVPESALRATVYYSVKTLLDPGLPPNGGMFEAIDIAAPEGCLVNPRYPAAVGARSITCNKIARAIFGAFAPLLPDENVMAAGHDAIPAIVFSGERRGGAGPFVYLETIGGGAGARSNEGGMDAVHVHMTNTSNRPAEALEHGCPPPVEEEGLVPASGGGGTQAGGRGGAPAGGERSVPVGRAMTGVPTRGAARVGAPSNGSSWAGGVGLRVSAVATAGSAARGNGDGGTKLARAAARGTARRRARARTVDRGWGLIAATPTYTVADASRACIPPWSAPFGPFASCRYPAPGS